MPRTADDVKARLRKRLYDKSLALQETPVVAPKSVMRSKRSTAKETIDKIIELKIRRRRRRY